jgi:pimeloyl-ACP methyl ester carboxylesterase
MRHLRVDGYDMAYIEVGEGTPLVLVHGTLCDFRVWSAVLGLLSRRCRVIAPSLRHFFPEHWDGKGGDFTMARHVADMIAFIDGLGLGPVDLLGHSRGGHVAFRVAQQRPDLLHKLILAEPGGDLDATLAAPGSLPALRGHVAAAAEKVAKGDVEGGLSSFMDGIEGTGAWRVLPEAVKQELRDNALTLLGQINEARPPCSRAEAEAIRVPTLLVAGEHTKGGLPVILRALAAHIPEARIATIPHATHPMFEQNPRAFCEAVLEFLG